MNQSEPKESQSERQVNQSEPKESQSERGAHVRCTYLVQLILEFL